MADHIPFITGDEVCSLVNEVYSDSAFVRVPLDRAKRLLPRLSATKKVWLDPCVDGMHDLQTRRSTKEDKSNPWFKFMTDFPNFEKIGTPPYRASAAEVDAFVEAVMKRCAAYKPAWITVPQIPLVTDSDRNKINRALAAATGTWKSSQRFSGSLILPLIFTNQAQMNLKTARNQKVQQAQKCYQEARADGFWVVDASLNDESGSATLRNKRFPGVIALHEELNASIPSRIRIAGPYWGLNLVLWARNLVDHPAIGIGSGYQFLLAGVPTKKSRAKLALPSLRRRATVRPKLQKWLENTIGKLAPSHPAHVEFSEIKRHYTVLSAQDQARERVAVFYKQWFDIIAAAPKAGRSMALFQDLAGAYALGKSLPPLGADEGTARRPEAVAEPLMLSCL
jgi:hypothetical protein